MPELPEVETIKRGLEKTILKKRINNARVLEARSVLPSCNVFIRGLKGRKIVNIARRGKYLIFGLDDGRIMLAHLRMTGQLVLADKNIEPNKFTRVVFEFVGGQKLFFNDIRKFGRLELLSKNYHGALLPRVGTDALGIDLKKFHKALRARARSSIKAALLDQRYFSGIGNIYADEICHAAKILPTRASSNLNEKEISSLYKAMRSLLKKSIRHGGTSFSDYVDASGRKGDFLKHLKVYGREGDKCLRCRKTTIKKIRLAGRGTRYCNQCQK